MDCKNCNTKLKESANFCPECATKVVAPITSADTSENHITIRCQACGHDYPASPGLAAPCPKCNGGEDVSEKQKASSWTTWSKPGYGAAAFLILFGVIFYLSNQGARYGADFYTNMHNIVVNGFSILIIGLGLSVAFYFKSKD